MRQINVRAWDNVEMKMYYAGEEELILFMFDSNGIITDKIIPDDSIDGFHSEKLEHLQYMESTGLKDKNGREIYEGDILHYQSRHSATYDLLVVSWSDTDACFLMGGVRTDYAIRYGEVVGNIYEDSEMLGDDK